MLNLALTAVESALTSLEIDNVPLIEKYGGLTFAVNFPESIGTTANNEPIMKDRIFPVACGVSFNDCVANQRYQELSPNSKYKSLAYWEQLSDATQNNNLSQLAAKGGMVVYDIPARLVVWLNMAKLNLNGTGQTDCSIAAPIALKIQTALYRKNGFFIQDAAYQGAKVQLEFVGQEQKDANRIFGRYSYGKDLTKFMLHPYDFFALRYNVRLWINRNCIESFTLGTAIDCPVIGTAES